ncbi:subtilisin SUB12 [Cardiosporidium cionae]|uniref:subtilisin n=1 Tax=Cardiosporidium cionae TaxID=476202 RepID=A0ABQ7J9T9_9APIC|nr:subtilisin SUB12 [Cardiosporidium cionae]|eukprot:KAF8820778.1 subtilisin SUB12 [Cardiosporidium cionae]
MEHSSKYRTSSNVPAGKVSTTTENFQEQLKTFSLKRYFLFRCQSNFFINFIFGWLCISLVFHGTNEEVSLQAPIHWYSNLYLSNTLFAKAETLEVEPPYLLRSIPSSKSMPSNMIFGDNLLQTREENLVGGTANPIYVENELQADRISKYLIKEGVTSIIVAVDINAVAAPDLTATQLNTMELASAAISSPTSTNNITCLISNANPTEMIGQDSTSINNAQLQVVQSMETHLNDLLSSEASGAISTVKSCKYLRSLSVFLLRLNSSKAGITSLIQKLWEENLQIWMIEADSVIKFRDTKGKQLENMYGSFSTCTEYSGQNNSSCMNNSKTQFQKNSSNNHTTVPTKSQNEGNSSSKMEHEASKNAGDQSSIYAAVSKLLQPIVVGVEEIIEYILPKEFQKYFYQPVDQGAVVRQNLGNVYTPSTTFGSFLQPLIFQRPSSTPIQALSITNANSKIEPNDTYFGQQWGLRNLLYPQVDTDAISAWELLQKATALRNVVVAHIDTGIDITHPDLRDRIWVNPGEIPDDNIDNDGNGYVDDVHGWNFVDNNNNVMDTDGHGTHTAGILGATANNGVGIAGIAPAVTIMPLKIFDRASQAVEAIDYSVNKGIKISTNSWGFTIPVKSLRLAMERVAAAGQLFVCAVNNEARDNTFSPDFPSNWGPGTTNQPLPNILRVASVDIDGSLSSTSNFGRINVDIGAPGSDILSTVPFNLFGGAYAYKSGTSMATPLVAGTAALISSVVDIDNLRLRQLIVQTANPLNTLSGRVNTGGIVNSAAALRVWLAFSFSFLAQRRNETI